MAVVFVDLVTDAGQLVRIECPKKFEDQLHDSLNNAMQRGDWFSCARFDGCSLEFMGLSLDRFFMPRVVGML